MKQAQKLGLGKEVTIAECPELLVDSVRYVIIANFAQNMNMGTYSGAQ